MTILLMTFFFLIGIFSFYHEFIFSIFKVKKQTVYLGRYENKKYEDLIHKINLLSDQKLIEKQTKEEEKEKEIEVKVKVEEKEKDKEIEKEREEEKEEEEEKEKEKEIEKEIEKEKEEVETL